MGLPVRCAHFDLIRASTGDHACVPAFPRASLSESPPRTLVVLLCASSALSASSASSDIRASEGSTSPPVRRAPVRPDSSRPGASRRTGPRNSCARPQNLAQAILTLESGGRLRLLDVPALSSAEAHAAFATPSPAHLALALLNSTTCRSQARGDLEAPIVRARSGNACQPPAVSIRSRLSAGQPGSDAPTMTAYTRALQTAVRRIKTAGRVDTGHLSAWNAFPKGRECPSGSRATENT